MRSTPPLFDGLEPRTLCSAGQFRALEPAYPGCADSPAVDAALVRLASSDTAVRARNLASRTAVSTAIANARENDPAVLAAQSALDSARVASRSSVDADLAAIRAVYAAHRPAIQADLAAMRAHRGDPAALAADRAQLATDRRALAADLAPIQARLRANRSPIVEAEAAVRNAINTNASVVAARAVLQSAGSRPVTEARQLQGVAVSTTSDQLDGLACIRIGSGVTLTV